MSEKNISIINRLSKKNIKDTIILSIITVSIVAVMIFVDNKTVMISYAITILLFYFLQYQYSRSELMKSIDKLIDNELRDFQKISARILQLSERQKQLTDKYINTLNEVMQITRQFKNNVSGSKEKTQNLSSKMQESFEYTSKESKSLNNSILLIQKLKQKVQVIAELIIELTDYVKQVGSTVSIVKNISEQTNMLALNAAVEAARAGEYGKGFAVVAGEIRKLADESKQAANKITFLVTEIERTTSSTIVATEDSAKDIEIGYKNAASANDNISNLVSRIKEFNSDISEILSSSSQQNSVVNDVLEKIEDIQKSTSDTVHILEENIENIKAFSEISTNIKDNIAN